MTSRTLPTAALLLAATTALAHDGPRIWLDTAGGKITTFDGPYPPGSDATKYHPDRVFAIEMADPNDGDGVDFQSEFPAYQRLPGGAALASGSTFSYDIAAEPLWYAPGTGGAAGTFQTLSQHFGPTGTPRLAISNELGVTRYTAGGFVAGTAAYQYNAEGDHGHLTYTLQGLNGGTAFGGADGIYALPLDLTLPGAGASPTFYVLLGKNADPARLVEAKAVLEATLVPEPASLAGVALAAALLRRRRVAR